MGHQVSMHAGRQRQLITKGPNKNLHDDIPSFFTPGKADRNK